MEKAYEFKVVNGKSRGIHALMEMLMDQCEFEASNAQSVLELQKGSRWDT